ncbi:MAG: peptide deformylase [Flavobacteriales bacterium]|nr:peptide deformylase [Flavobacteriales bacterium]
MILPIVAYGDPVLQQEGKELTPGHPGLSELIDNMFETMYSAHGVGLAAPQVGQGLKLFVVDASPFAEDEPSLENFKKVFINPVILSEEGDEWTFNEGCLSFPDLRIDIDRQEQVTIRYQDRDFNTHEETYTGLAARVIQHEYDHVYGIVFTDRVTPIRRRMLKGKMNNIAKGKVQADYKMRIFSSKGSTIK